MKWNQEVSPAMSLVAFVVLAIVLTIAWIPNFFEGSTRAKVARVKADQRSLATGLEAYYVDQGCYPAWTSLSGSNKWTGEDGLGHINAFSGRGTGASSIHSFRVRTALPDKSAANQFFMLTTPVSYISSIMPDPFADTKGATYGYYATATGYIVYSFGEDRDEAPNAQGHVGDIDSALEATDLLHVRTGNPESLYDPNAAQPSITLICGPTPPWAEAHGTGAFTYDPTNGTTSEGDVWRVKN